MSAESEFYCSKCGHEWEAVPPSSCPKCSPMPDAGCPMPEETHLEMDEVDAAHSAWSEKLKALVTEHYGARCPEDEAGCPTCVVWRAVDRIIDPLELAMDADRTEAGRLQARVAELENRINLQIAAHEEVMEIAQRIRGIHWRHDGDGGVEQWADDIVELSTKAIMSAKGVTA